MPPKLELLDSNIALLALGRQSNTKRSMLLMHCARLISCLFQAGAWLVGCLYLTGTYLHCVLCLKPDLTFVLCALQPEPYQDFSAESAALTASLGDLGRAGAAYVMGDALAGLQWHIYLAEVENVQLLPQEPTYSLEVCMTDLCPLKVRIAAGSGFALASQHLRKV